MTKKKNRDKHKQIPIEQSSTNDDTFDKIPYGLICIIDALGTKGVWGQIGPQKYINKLNLLEDLLEKSKKDFMKTNPNIDFDVKSFSDTFFITLQFPLVKENEEHGYSVYIKWFSSVIADLFVKALADRIFFRGAISHGKFLKKDNKIIGPAVDDVASYFERPDIIGIVCTPSAGYAYKSSRKFTSDELNYLIDYPVPLKNPECIEDLVILDWPKLFYERTTNVKNEMNIDYHSSMYRYFSEYPISQNTINKYKNTLSFFNYSIDYFLKGTNKKMKKRKNEFHYE